MTWNLALEAGGWLVGRTVTIEVEVGRAKRVRPTERPGVG